MKKNNSTEGRIFQISENHKKPAKKNFALFAFTFAFFAVSFLIWKINRKGGKDSRKERKD